jgi:Fe-Mn family superoxide dismutase
MFLWNSKTIVFVHNEIPMKGSAMMTRREAIKTATLATAACATILPALGADAPPSTAAAPATATGPFTVPPLPYAYDALEPHIDARTMRIHHDKHHAAYVANLNKAVAAHPDLAQMPVEDLITKLYDVPEDVRTAVENNGGGHYNHSLFWQMMKKDGGGEPSGDLATAINQKFDSFAGFKEAFTKAAMGRFGSGWAWLVLHPNKTLGITSTANQDSPLMVLSESESAAEQALRSTLPAGGFHPSRPVPLLGIDVWEHAYYLKYQNVRADYVSAFFNVIDWDFVGKRLQKAMAA